MILNPWRVNLFSLLFESFKSSLSVLDFWYFLMICIRVSLFLSNSGFSWILSVWKHILQFCKNFCFLCSSILERCLLDHLNLASTFITFFFLIFLWLCLLLFYFLRNSLTFIIESFDWVFHFYNHLKNSQSLFLFSESFFSAILYLCFTDIKSYFSLNW